MGNVSPVSKQILRQEEVTAAHRVRFIMEKAVYQLASLISKTGDAKPAIHP